MSKIFGYARVSAKDQNLATQLDSLQAAGCNAIFQEKITGTSTSRPQLDALLAQLRPGDQVVVSRFFRLGRSTAHLLELMQHFQQNGIHFRALDLGVDTTTPAGKLVATVFAGLAQYQREEMLEKTAHGRELAKQAGKHMGRRPGVDTERLAKVRHAYKAGIPLDNIVYVTGIPRSTVQRYIKLIDAEPA